MRQNKSKIIYTNNFKPTLKMKTTQIWNKTIICIVLVYIFKLQNIFIVLFLHKTIFWLTKLVLNYKFVLFKTTRARRVIFSPSNFLLVVKSSANKQNSKPYTTSKSCFTTFNYCPSAWLLDVIFFVLIFSRSVVHSILYFNLTKLTQKPICQ